MISRISRSERARWSPWHAIVTYTSEHFAKKRQGRHHEKASWATRGVAYRRISALRHSGGDAPGHRWAFHNSSAASALRLQAWACARGYRKWLEIPAAAHAASAAAPRQVDECTAHGRPFGNRIFKLGPVLGSGSRPTSDDAGRSWAVHSSTCRGAAADAACAAAGISGHFLYPRAQAHA